MLKGCLYLNRCKTVTAGLNLLVCMQYFTHEANLISKNVLQILQLASVIRPLRPLVECHSSRSSILRCVCSLYDTYFVADGTPEYNSGVRQSHLVLDDTKFECLVIVPPFVPPFAHRSPDPKESCGQRGLECSQGCTFISVRQPDSQPHLCHRSETPAGEG